MFYCHAGLPARAAVPARVGRGARPISKPGGRRRFPLPVGGHLENFSLRLFQARCKLAPIAAKDSSACTSVLLLEREIEDRPWQLDLVVAIANVLGY